MNPRPLDCQSSALPAAPRPQSNVVSFTRIRPTVKQAQGRDKTAGAVPVRDAGARDRLAPNAASHRSRESSSQSLSESSPESSSESTFESSFNSLFESSFQSTVQSSVESSFTSSSQSSVESSRKSLRNTLFQSSAQTSSQNSVQTSVHSVTRTSFKTFFKSSPGGSPWFAHSTGELCSEASRPPHIEGKQADYGTRRRREPWPQRGSRDSTRDCGVHLSPDLET